MYTDTMNSINHKPINTGSLLEIINSAIIVSKKNRNANKQIAHAGERMRKIQAMGKTPTAIVFTDGVQENPANEKYMYTIDYDGMDILKSIDEAVKIIIEKGCFYTGRVYYMCNADSCEEITEYVQSKLSSNESYNRVLSCKKDMDSYGAFGSAIVFSNGLKKSDTESLNSIVYHEGMNIKSMIKRAARLIVNEGRGKYDGRIILMSNHTGNEIDVTEKVMWIVAKLSK